MIEVRQANNKGGGRGVFATSAFQVGDIVGSWDILIIPITDETHIEKTILDRYWFMWSAGVSCLVMGAGSFINHSYVPNVRYERDYDNDRMVFRAIRQIESGDEIMSNYNGDPADRTAMDFYVT